MCEEFRYIQLNAVYERLHLQWFAAEDEGRTEQATERKLRKAREEGKVAKTADLPASVTLLVVVALLGLLGENFLRNLSEMTMFYFRNSVEIDVSNSSVLWSTLYTYFMRMFLPIAAASVLAAVVGNIAQVGFLFTTKPLNPDWKRIVPNFKQFFTRTVFSPEGLYNLLKLFGKISIIAGICYINIRDNVGVFAGFMNMPVLYSFAWMGRVAFFILMEVALVFLGLSFIDYAFQRRKHFEQLKMTKQEIKEERKSEEGNPHVRSRLRQRMQELLSRTMIRKVPEADVVVTNPTHYSVAVEYDARKMEAPMVIAKGADNLALRIRSIAREHEVPIIENRPLARGLYHDVEIGDVIPEKYYEAMVTVLSEVYRMKGE